MRIKTSELEGMALDWSVAKCEDQTRKNYGLLKRIQIFTGAHTGLFRLPKSTLHSGSWYKPSTDWSQGGPILTREHISRTIDHSGLWIAYWTDGYTEGDEGKKWMQCDRSELVAGMRCYVASKLGDEVEIPEELT